jgi:hypothetical protein
MAGGGKGRRAVSCLNISEDADPALAMPGSGRHKLLPLSIVIVCYTLTKELGGFDYGKPERKKTELFRRCS